LILSYASTTIDQTPEGYSWAGGDSYNYRTMERFSPDLSGDFSNWGTNNTLIRNGKNADGQPINGTPKARNSVNYLVAKGQSYISSDITLTKENSPYFVGNPYSSGSQVFQGTSTLTIEPGVVIKFYPNSGWVFTENSKIIAKGEAGNDKQIVFTTFSDDIYGGDLDTNSNIPVPLFSGSWYGIEVQADGSVFDHTIFRYGGQWWSGVGNHAANLSVKDASATITNSIFEYSKVYGLKLSNSNSIVSNNILRNNNETGPAGYGVGIEVFGGSPLIQSNEFSNNYRGLFLVDSRANVNLNQFSSSTNAAIYAAGSLGDIFDNSGSTNGINGIVISGNLTRPNETATLKPNPLAYILDSYSSTVVASSTLIVRPGVVVKGNYDSRLYVDGTLALQGLNPGDIVFTSLYDNPRPGYWQGIIANPGSVTDIKGATFAYADKAISYYNSPIKLENVDFKNNNLAVWADAGTLSQTITALLVNFLNDDLNAATTSPRGLFLK